MASAPPCYHPPPSMLIQHIRQRLRDLGAAPCHEGRVLRAWAQGLSLDTKRRRAENFLPLALRDAMPGLTAELQGLARLHSDHPGEDGSVRLLVELADGQTSGKRALPREGAVHFHPGRLCRGLRLISRDRPKAACCASCASPKSSPRWFWRAAVGQWRRVVLMGMGSRPPRRQCAGGHRPVGTEGGVGHKNLVFPLSVTGACSSGCHRPR